MKRHEFPDLGKVMDEIFAAAEDFTQAFTDGLQFMPGDKAWKWNPEFYSGYSYPPANIYMTEDKTLVFEFAIAGFGEQDISLEFKGDYLVFSGKLPEEMEEPSGARYFKRRLKRKSFGDQRYYVPEDKFNRDAVKAVYRHGILSVTIPPRDDAKSEPGVRVVIVNEDEADADAEKKGDR